MDSSDSWESHQPVGSGFIKIDQEMPEKEAFFWPYLHFIFFSVFWPHLKSWKSDFEVRRPINYQSLLHISSNHLLEIHFFLFFFLLWNWDMQSGHFSLTMKSWWLVTVWKYWGVQNKTKREQFYELIFDHNKVHDQHVNGPSKMKFDVSVEERKKKIGLIFEKNSRKNVFSLRGPRCPLFALFCAFQYLGTSQMLFQGQR